MQRWHDARSGFVEPVLYSLRPRVQFMGSVDELILVLPFDVIVRDRLPDPQIFQKTGWQIVSVYRRMITAVSSGNTQRSRDGVLYMNYR